MPSSSLLVCATICLSVLIGLSVSAMIIRSHACHVPSTDLHDPIGIYKTDNASKSITINPHQFVLDAEIATAH